MLYETTDDFDSGEEQRREEDEEYDEGMFILRSRKTTLRRRLRPPKNIIGNDFYHFLKRMLMIDPEKRMTIQEACEHRFLK